MRIKVFVVFALIWIAMLLAVSSVSAGGSVVLPDTSNAIQRLFVSKSCVSDAITNGLTQAQAENACIIHATAFGFMDVIELEAIRIPASWADHHTETAVGRAIEQLLRQGKNVADAIGSTVRIYRSDSFVTVIAKNQDGVYKFVYSMQRGDLEFITNFAVDGRNPWLKANKRAQAEVMFMTTAKAIARTLRRLQQG